MAFVFNDLQLWETPNKDDFSSSLMSLIENIIFCPLLTQTLCFHQGELFPTLLFGYAFIPGAPCVANLGNFELFNATSNYTCHIYFSILTRGHAY